MAQKPVFESRKCKPFVIVSTPEFVWNGGLSASQKTRNVVALHNAYNARFPEKKVLEISTKSTEKLGVQLSAFNLKKYVPALGTSVPVECVYQGSKVFAADGPFEDLYTATSRQAKGDHRLRSSGELRRFFFDGRNFPLNPLSAFYDWLYINALLENPELAAGLMEYDAFTDIEFNPSKGFSCQAHAAALYVSLSRLGLLAECREFDSFVRLLK